MCSLAAGKKFGESAEQFLGFCVYVFGRMCLKNSHAHLTHTQPFN